MTRDFIINAIEDSEGCPFPEVPCPLHDDCEQCIKEGIIAYENAIRADERKKVIEEIKNVLKKEDMQNDNN